jgi:hypothetical protein
MFHCTDTRSVMTLIANGVFGKSRQPVSCGQINLITLAPKNPKFIGTMMSNSTSRFMTRIRQKRRYNRAIHTSDFDYSCHYATVPNILTDRHMHPE